VYAHVRIRCSDWTLAQNDEASPVFR